MNESNKVNKKLRNTLNTEVISFSNSLPYWAKYLAKKLLADTTLEDEDYNVALDYFKEDNQLKDKIANRSVIYIELSEDEEFDFKEDLVLNEIKNLQGVNALAEDQSIELSTNVTIVYGANSSGKTGYIRLLNNAFFSRSSDKDIIPNIKKENKHKPPSCEFVFQSDGITYSLKYPDDSGKSEFQQFSIFDRKSVLVHLNDKKEFVFRPKALDFFADLISSYTVVKDKLNSEISEKKSLKDYTSLFDGDSQIKEMIEELSSITKINDLKKHTPFTDKDREKRTRLEDKKIELNGIKKNKDDQIEELETIQRLLTKLIEDITANNSFFTAEKIKELYTSISDYNMKRQIAKKEGIENFKTDKVKNVGSPEWKAFIEAAEAFANKQDKEKYPKHGDNCLLCQQPLKENEVKLIESYWAFIKSKAEEDARKSKKVIDEHRDQYEQIEFNLFPEDNILTEWVKKNYYDTYKTLIKSLQTQQKLCKNIKNDFIKQKPTEWEPYKVEIINLSEIDSAISEKIKELNEKDVDQELSRVDEAIIYLNHKEKLSTHIEEIEKHVDDLKWITKAENKLNKFNPRSVTEKGKKLSKKYFGQAYQDKFTEECNALNAHFDIELLHSGSYGSSYREFKIGDRLPSLILSEGEQRAISMADFLSEMQLSEINRGIVLDDPVNSLDDERKSNIAERLVKEGQKRQVLIFTHDLVFLSSIIGYCEELKVNCECHWMENLNRKPGIIHLRNTPSFEKSYKKSVKAQAFYNNAIKSQPEEREINIKNGFAALRTSYEALVIFDLFGGVVQRFNERVSIDSLSSVYFNEQIRDEVIDNFNHCCRYMEGHSHSNKYSYKKPDTNNLKEEIDRFNSLKRKLKELKKL